MKRLAVISLIIALSIITGLATIRLYDSPITKNPPEMITRGEVEAMKWLIENRYPSLTIEGLRLYYMGRFTNYIWGCKESRSNPMLTGGPLDIYNTLRIPPHFNYENEPLLAKTLGKPCYLFITRRSELISTEVYPEYKNNWYFTPEDYLKLDYDRSLALVFQNDDVKIYKVKVEIK